MLSFVDRRLKFSQKRYRKESLKEAIDDGFYFENDEIRCFCCDGINYNHLESCAFVKDDNNNVAITDRYSLYYEKERRKTFIEWPFPDIVSPDDLAKDGFYYLREKDLVACVFCRGILGAWEAGDDVRKEHKKHHPVCAYVNDYPVGNVTLRQSQILGERVVKGEIVKGPPHVDDRVRTFDSRWPERVGVTPRKMAEAGFFLVGPGDLVKCFICGVALRNWNYENDPWLEHARFSPKCLYVLLHKGDEYVKDSINKPKKRLSDEDLDFLLDDFDITKSLITTINRNILRYVLKTRLEETGLPYFTVESCMIDLKRYEDRNVVISLKKINYYNYDDDDDDDDECKICMENPISVCFLPCKHFRLCADCAISVDDCPFCKRVISHKFKVKFENKCQMCFEKHKSTICFLPCKHLQLCAYCAIITIPHTIFPIQCPTCNVNSDCNFQVIF